MISTIIRWLPIVLCVIVCGIDVFAGAEMTKEEEERRIGSKKYMKYFKVRRFTTPVCVILAMIAIVYFFVAK